MQKNNSTASPCGSARSVCFLQLSTDLLVHILQEWLAGDHHTHSYEARLIGVLSKLDVACCNRAMRPTLLDIIAFPIHPHMRGGSAAQLPASSFQWIVDRRVSAACLAASSSDAPLSELPAVKHLILQHLPPVDIPNTSVLVPQFMQWCPQMTSLALSGFPSASIPELLQPIGHMYSSRLKELALGSVLVSDEQTVHALSGFLRLQYLQIHVCSLSFLALADVLGQLTRLRRLVLGCQGLGFNDLQAMVMAGQASLKEVTVVFSQSLGVKLQPMRKAFPFLDQLQLVSGTGAVIEGYCLSHRSLTYMHNRFERSTEEGAARVLEICPTVTALTIHSFSLTSAALLESIGGTVGSSLLELSLYCLCETFAANGRSCLLAHCSRLQRLTMKSATVSDGSMQQLSAYCPLLQYASFENSQPSTLLGDTGMIALLAGCQELREVEVMCRNCMTYLTLRAVLSRRGPLRKLTVRLIGDKQAESNAHIHRFYVEAKQAGLPACACDSKCMLMIRGIFTSSRLQANEHYKDVIGPQRVSHETASVGGP